MKIILYLIEITADKVFEFEQDEVVGGDRLLFIQCHPHTPLYITPFYAMDKMLAVKFNRFTVRPYLVIIEELIQKCLLFQGILAHCFLPFTFGMRYLHESFL